MTLTRDKITHLLHPICIRNHIQNLNSQWTKNYYKSLVNLLNQAEWLFLLAQIEIKILSAQMIPFSMNLRVTVTVEVDLYLLKMALRRLLTTAAEVENTPQWVIKIFSVLTTKRKAT